MTRSKLSDHAEEDDFKSQYFDAQESLSEEEDDDSADEYTDIEDTDDIPSPAKMRRRRSLTVPYPGGLPKTVQKRVNALKNLLLKQKEIEVDMFKDLHK